MLQLYVLFLWTETGGNTGWALGKDSKVITSLRSHWSLQGAEQSAWPPPTPLQEFLSGTATGISDLAEFLVGSSPELILGDLSQVIVSQGKMEH